MKSLYEKIDSLEEFTSLKENIVKSEDMVEIVKISLRYGKRDETLEIFLYANDIFGFNVFGNKGYCVANLEDFIIHEELFKTLMVSNEIEELIVHFSDGTTKEYCIIWSSIFDKITGNTYIMLFECKEPSYRTLEY